MSGLGSEVTEEEFEELMSKDNDIHSSQFNAYPTFEQSPIPLFLPYTTSEAIPENMYIYTYL